MSGSVLTSEYLGAHCTLGSGVEIGDMYDFIASIKAILKSSLRNEDILFILGNKDNKNILSGSSSSLLFAVAEVFCIIAGLAMGAEFERPQPKVGKF